MASYTSFASSPSYAEDGTLYMAAPLPGYTRRPETPPNLHGALYASCIATTMVALMAVGLRIFTRYTSRGKLYPDDYLLVIAMILSLSLLGVTFEFCKSGLGMHLWDITVAEFSPTMPGFETASTMLYSLSIAFSRLSILALYLQLTHDKYFRYLVWTLISTTCAYVVAYELIALFGCTPVEASWDISKATDPNTKCINKLANYAFLSASNIIMDLAVLLLPIRIVWTLQMPIRQKISVFFVFSPGALVCGIAIKRLTLLPSLMTSPDYSWDAARQYHWALGEVSAGIVCASIPALKPLFGGYISSLIQSQAALPSHKDSSSEKIRDKLSRPIWRQSTSQNASRGGGGHLNRNLSDTVFRFIKRDNDGGETVPEAPTSNSSLSSETGWVKETGDYSQRSLGTSSSPLRSPQAGTTTTITAPWTAQSQGRQQETEDWDLPWSRRKSGRRSATGGGEEIEYHSWLQDPIGGRRRGKQSEEQDHEEENQHDLQPPPRSHQRRQNEQQKKHIRYAMIDSGAPAGNWWASLMGKPRPHKDGSSSIRNSWGSSSSAAEEAIPAAPEGGGIHVLRQTTVDFGRRQE